MPLLLLLALPAVVEAQFYCTTNNGTITITGYYGPDCDVTIPSTITGLPVTSIGGWAFLSSFSVTNVTIGDSVTNIEDYAFSQCHSLTSVSIPNSVSSLGDCAFFATGLSSLTIPNGVTSIGDYAFECCFSLTSVTIGTNVASIGDAAFQDCYSLMQFTVDTNNSVYSSLDGGLFDKTQTSLIQYPTAVAGNYAIPNSVSSIGDGAFASATNLISVMIPNNVSSIGDGAFSFASGLTNLTIPNSVTNIGSGAFAFCTSLASVTMGTNVASIGDDVFDYCSSLAAITVDAGNAFYSSLDGILFNKSQTTLIQYPAGRTGGYTIPKSVTSIGYGAFAGSAHLTNVTIPNSVTNIGGNAFYSCISLTGICLQGNTPTLGSSVFDGDGNAVVYYLPKTTGWDTTFGGRPTVLWNPQVQTSGVRTNQFGFNISGTNGWVIVVEACTNLANSVWSPVSTNTLTGGSSYFNDPQWANYPSRFYRLGWALPPPPLNYTTNSGTITITGYTGSGGDVTIPSTINGLPFTCIADQAFVGCRSLTSVMIPNSVTSIGEGAFLYCSSLTAIAVDSLNSFYTAVVGVLFNKSQTTLVAYPGGKAGSYTIPSSVTSIGSDAFWYCTSLTSVTIPNSVTNIGDSAFISCSGLTTVTIPNSVISIGSDAFGGCWSLTSVTIPDTITSLEDGVFSSCFSLTSITIPNSVTNIGDYALSACTSLTSVTIPNSVRNIGLNAFSACYSLTAIAVDSLNSLYTAVAGVLFNKSQTTLVAYPGGKAGSYTIPSSVTSIGDGAFEGCTNLTSITIPDSVTGIGFCAFMWCTKLASITIPNNVTNIGYEAFFGCTNLTNITIPNSVTNIGFAAFSSCTSLTNVTIGTGVTTIEDSTFAACPSLTSVYFQGNAPTVGLDVFDGDNKATVYYLPGPRNWYTPFGGLTAVLWNAQVQTGGASFGVRTNRFGFNIIGTSNLVVVVEACTNLANPVWSPLQTITLTGSPVYFTDPQWTNHNRRFYGLGVP